MPLSLNTQEIVTSFSQTTEADFAVDTLTGASVIAQEVHYQAQRLLDVLHPQIRRMIVSERIEEIVPIAAVAPGVYQITPTFVPTDNVVRFRSIPKSSYVACTTDQCLREADWQLLSQPYTFSDSLLDPATTEAVIQYTFDANALASLRSALRDLVCCNLGSRLFPGLRADDWSIVRHYCASAREILSRKDWIPPEFLNIRLSSAELASIRFLRIARG